MSPYETAAATAAYQTRCQDRVATWEDGERVVIAVADGAGGIGDGEQAAESVIRELQSVCRQTESADACASALRQVDLRIGAGESTAAVVSIGPAGICGASVGDSRIWTIKDGKIDDLTGNQQRKPLLGSGGVFPVGFAAPPLDGLLLAATDGLFNYVKQPQLIGLIQQAPFVELPRRLIELVRLKSGELWDDVGVVVCRRRPVQRSRRKYELLVG
jgi:serine/threonine protein phosphatase PrpC